MKIDPKDVAILTIHGNGTEYDGEYALAYPWPKLQLDKLRQHTPAGYTVIAYGNELMPEHEAILRNYPEVELHKCLDPQMGHITHVWPVRNWLVEQNHCRFRYLITLDSDAFPIADGWLDRCLGMLNEDTPVIAAQRLENGDTHSDRCFMAFTSEAWLKHRFDFSSEGVVDAGGRISAYLETHSLNWVKLRRSNQWNPHVLTAGIYGDMIYHHAGGTRLPRYRINQHKWNDKHEWQKEVLFHRGLMDLLFKSPDEFIQKLKGNLVPMSEKEILAHGLKVAGNVDSLAKRIKRLIDRIKSKM